MKIIETNLEFRSLTPRDSTVGMVLHHTGADDVDLSAEEIHAIHLNNGWSGCGYHFVIRKSGAVERGRPEPMMGAHCPGANYNRLGVHVCGCFAEQLPNDEQLAALRELIAGLCREYELDLAGENVITGHRDWLATACPGDKLYGYIPELKERVAAI